MKTVSLIAALFLATCAPAVAQSCGPTELMYSTLKDQYGEAPIFLGTQADGSIIEIWVGDDTWTAFVTLPNGTSCNLTDGMGYSRPALPANL